MKEERKCRCCQATLKGRADQKFCTTHCRSSFHNAQNRMRLNFVRIVNKELLKNRKILEQFWSANVREIKPEQLENIGYQPNRFTGLLKGDVYCCYDFGIRYLKTDLIQIIALQKQQIILHGSG